MSQARYLLTKRGHIAIFLDEYNSVPFPCPECRQPVRIFAGRYTWHASSGSKMCFASGTPAGEP